MPGAIIAKYDDCSLKRSGEPIVGYAPIDDLEQVFSMRLAVLALGDVIE